MDTLRTIYRGRVQGVGFRFRTRRVANAYEVMGYVKNLPDGTVELIAQGESAEVERFLVGVGEEMGRLITGTQSSPVGNAPVFDAFDIAY